ncbi:MAG: GNAT family N-acetyltransferase [Bacteroidales bacterium]|nr:GNAT family N-acetyltransferase [Bacteroidales bacterium]
MQKVIDPIAKELIIKELTDERFLRKTNKGGNEIYIVNHHNAPNTMQEIGRLREVAFREAGGGTGLPIDLDEYDTMENPFHQLLVWNPDAQEIIGGYRYLFGDEISFDEHGHPLLATAHLFNMSDKFLKEYMPYTVELGRSFVTLEYQSSKAGAKALFALDNLWDGLGALPKIKPNLQYYFGKVTMYPNYHKGARDMILHFWNKYFPDADKLVEPITPIIPHWDTDVDELDKLFSTGNFKGDYKVLNQEVRKLGLNIPPLVNAYMSLSPTMKVFGTAVNHEFGEVEETGILIKIDEIFAEKRIRHMDTFEEF